MRRCLIAGLILVLLSGCGKADEAKQAVQRKTEAASEAAGKVTDSVISAMRGALALGKRAKDELDKVYKTTRDYDLAIERDAERTAAGAAHAAKLAQLPHVTVAGITVGYEEDAHRSIGGVTYSKHFRASWRRGDEIVRVSYFTQEQLDVLAFAALVERIVPVVERVL